GATNTAVTRFPGEKFGNWFPNTFDRVLLDAPCSMQGLRTAESHDSRPVTEKESRLLSQRQVALLTSALQALRIGGEVVYSTCTLLPLENEGVVESVLSKYGNSVVLLDAQKALPNPAPGIQRGGGLEYQHDMGRVIRLWPHRFQTAGFFACLLQKTGEIPHKPVPAPEHSMEAAGFNELSNIETNRFANEFAQWTGYDLSLYLVENRRVLVRRDQRVFIFPALLLERFRSLPVQSAGMLLGEWEGEEFILSHEWVLRFGKHCSEISVKLDEERFSHYTNGEDLIGFHDNVNSSSLVRVVADAAGRIAGRGRVVADRLKNLSSRQLR
ncbi:MAG: hypothetical protein Q7U74_11010, partial [Saprospiraceae bacterium]|nr:hypothetical protein [Saprospiraceae bacterium]